MEKLAATSPERLLVKKDEVAKLFKEHYESEENLIFLWVLRTSKETG